MKASSTPRVRRAIEDLQDDYAKGNKKPLETLMRAWKGIKELPPNDPHSFFMLGGYHGEPFRGAGWGSANYWGGYCNHGNILFPTWHRVYLLKIEEALQSIPGCADVMLPFWDETSADSQKNGIPWALTQENFVLDGATIPNPLRSFVFNRQITDNINGDNPNYSKPQGYETVRYPLSGLVGTKADQDATKAHNAMYQDFDKNVGLLNTNIVNWLTTAVVVQGNTLSNTITSDYKACLDAPNYTVFSNTTSSAEWNENSSVQVVPLEQPHDSMHLAVGGFDVPSFDASPIAGANGDMGENDTAGLDPIFYFHHCFVDRVFWLWQKKHGFTDHLEVIAGYPGTNSVDSQNPAPGVAPNSWLTLESALDPFKKKDGHAYTSLDCFNIEGQMGYTYGPGSLENTAAEVTTSAVAGGTKMVRVSGINRAAISGSFLISVFRNVEGKQTLIGTRAVLSRWSVQQCANCQTHLEAKAFMPLHGLQDASLTESAFEVRIQTRAGVLQQSAPAPATSAALLPTFQKKLFRIEVR